MIFEWVPFKAKQDLEFNFQKKEFDSKFMDHHFNLSEIMDLDENLPASADGKRDTGWSGINLWYFKLYLSTVSAPPQKGTAYRQNGDKPDKLEMMKSLPSIFQNTPSRTAFESLGKIIEPQIKLGISF
ncbi:MAG: hypothetical protein JW943_03790 [Deltaproteobacteria bacterium]|nr:hypothetical protein [Deltaproteobacteria bacterium]